MAQEETFTSEDLGVEIITDEQFADSFFGSDPEDVKIDNPKDKEEKPSNNFSEEKEEYDIFGSFTDETKEEETSSKESKSKEVKKEDSKEENQESESEEDENTFSVLSKNLFDLGIFNKYEDDEEEINISTPEDFRDRFLKEVQNQADSRIYDFLMDKHGEEGVEFFNSIFVNGVSPKDYLSKFNKIQSVKDLDLSKEENQELVFRQYYSKLEWEDEEIEKQLQKLKDYSDLEDESKKLQTKLVKQEEKELEKLKEVKEQEEKSKQAYQKHYREYVGTLLQDRFKKKDFDGIPLTDKTIREAYENLTIEKYSLPSGEKITEFDKLILDLRRPENYDKKVKLQLLLQNNLDLSKIQIKSDNKKTDKLFDKLTVKDKMEKRTGFSKF